MCIGVAPRHLRQLFRMEVNHAKFEINSFQSQSFIQGRNPESGVATTDLYGRCTRSHSGTSAAAPGLRSFDLFLHTSFKEIAPRGLISDRLYDYKRIKTFSFEL